MPRGKIKMGALSVDRSEAYPGRMRNRLRPAGFGTFLPGPKLEGFRLAQNPTRAAWYIFTYDVMSPVMCIKEARFFVKKQIDFLSRKRQIIGP